MNEKNEVAVSVEKNLASNDAPKVELGMQSLKRGNWDAKFKIDSSFKLSSGFKYSLDKLVNIYGSMEVDVSGKKCPIDFQNYYFTPFGYQIELNY